MRTILAPVRDGGRLPVRVGDKFELKEAETCVYLLQCVG